MDIEFHYYITYLIAARAGFSTNDALVLAHSCQYTDDNNLVFSIDKGRPSEYHNYISQTMNITKPRHDLLRIYPLFHFIPGDPAAPTAMRKDGKLHRLNTTPDNTNANKIIDDAIKTRNLYRIGIACHSYADTFAHQNFVGYYDGYNSMKGMLEQRLPEVGHAEAMHKPDWPRLIWEDTRLVSSISRIANKDRFKRASGRIYQKLRFYNKPDISDQDIKSEIQFLLNDIEEAIGSPDYDNKLKPDRIKRYKELSLKQQYGGKLLDDFDEEIWLKDAVGNSISDFRFKMDELLSDIISFNEELNWKDKDHYKETHWYNFQEAVKAHQNNAWEILDKSVFSELELEKL